MTQPGTLKTSPILVPSRNTGDAEAFGRFSHGNPAGDIGAVAAGQRTVVWAGWLPSPRESTPLPDPVGGIFPPDFRTWSSPGWEALKSTLAKAAAPLRESNATLCLRPCVGCVLADPQTCLTFLREHRPTGSEDRLEILLDPVAMLAPSMLAEVDDHLARAIDALADHSAVVGCVLTAWAGIGDRVLHKPLADHPEASVRIIDLWRGSDLAKKPVLVTDTRDIDLLATA